MNKLWLVFGGLGIGFVYLLFSLVKKFGALDLFLYGFILVAVLATIRLIIHAKRSPYG